MSFAAVLFFFEKFFVKNGGFALSTIGIIGKRGKDI